MKIKILNNNNLNHYLKTVNNIYIIQNRDIIDASQSFYDYAKYSPREGFFFGSYTKFYNLSIIKIDNDNIKYMNKLLDFSLISNSSSLKNSFQVNDIIYQVVSKYSLDDDLIALGKDFKRILIRNYLSGMKTGQIYSYEDLLIMKNQLTLIYYTQFEYEI